MSKPKLTYFDFSGSRGEECRLALFVAGVDFEDNRLPHDRWSDLKDSTPFGALPVLEIEGKGRLGESNDNAELRRVKPGVYTVELKVHGAHPGIRSARVARGSVGED